MSPSPDDASASPRQPDPLFAAPGPGRTGVPVVAWVAAGLAVLLVLAALLFASHREPAVSANVPLPPDPYASHLVFSDVTMSESTSLSGGKSTFIDGHIRNAGDRTVTAATLQVLFANDETLPPQVIGVPLTLIRTREPYVDTQPVSASPLGPGDEREFRLIFEDINANWNQQLPEIHVVKSTFR